MGEVIKINMPLEKWIEVQKKFETVNKKIPSANLDFEKYKFCKRWGLLICHLVAVEIGARSELLDPEEYN